MFRPLSHLRGMTPTTDTPTAAVRTERLATEFLATCLDPVRPGAIDRLSTEPKVRAIYAAAAAAIPDARFTPLWRVVQDTRAVFGGLVRGTHDGTFRDVPATGRPLEFLATVMIACAGEEIVDLMVVTDSLAMAEQIGLLAPLGPKACEPFKQAGL